MLSGSSGLRLASLQGIALHPGTSLGMATVMRSDCMFSRGIECGSVDCCVACAVPWVVSVYALCNGLCSMKSTAVIGNISHIHALPGTPHCPQLSTFAALNHFVLNPWHGVVTAAHAEYTHAPQTTQSIPVPTGAKECVLKFLSSRDAQALAYVSTFKTYRPII